MRSRGTTSAPGTRSHSPFEAGALLPSSAKWRMRPVRDSFFLPSDWEDLRPCPPDVALGTRKHGLREFADGNGFTHYLDSDIWEAEVRAAAHNPNTRLHISLNGFSGSSPLDKFMTAYRNGMGDDWFATEREMYHVGKAVRLGYRSWADISFYENGKLIKVPEPESW
jgi:hypothetical protein